MSSRDEIVGKLAGHREEWRAMAVRRLAIFGSVARGEESPESDVDVLVEFASPTTFDMYFDLKFRLEELLGRPVDLVTRKAMRPEIAPRIEKEAVYVA